MPSNLLQVHRPLVITTNPQLLQHLLVITPNPQQVLHHRNITINLLVVLRLLQALRPPSTTISCKVSLLPHQKSILIFKRALSHLLFLPANMATFLQVNQSAARILLSNNQCAISCLRSQSATRLRSQSELALQELKERDWPMNFLVRRRQHTI